MSLRCVVASDDDIDIAGNALADADFWDGDDGEVDSIDGYGDPVLRDIVVWENSTMADVTNRRTRGEFQPNVWPNTKRILIWGSRQGGLFATEAASIPVGVGTDILEVHGNMNLPCKAGFDWISDQTKLYASVDNAHVTGAIFAYSYGTPYPYQGGKMQWIRKVADAAETGADVFYQAWATDLTGITPGLDPDKKYILRGICHEAAATGKGAIGAYAQPQASAFKIFGPSWADFGMCVTIYMQDGILVDGEDGFVTKTASAAAADTPYVWLGFEEYEVKPGASAETTVNKVGGSVSPTSPGPSMKAPQALSPFQMPQMPSALRW